jgi:uncharacterized FlaG/YvyC family protein
MDVGKITVERDVFRPKNNATEGVSVPENSEKAVKQPARGVLSKLTGSMFGYNEHVRFTYNKEADTLIMRVVNLDTNEIIREIPSKNALKILQSMQNASAYGGLFIDESI